MKLLGNIVWFLLGGWLVFLVYAVGALFFFPMFVPLFRLALYSAWPFGKTAVSKTLLKRYRETTGKAADLSRTEVVLQGTSSVLNVLWLLTFGWVLALLHLLSAIANLMLFWLVVTIPNIAGHWKLIETAFMPFNKVIIPSELAEKIRIVLAEKKIDGEK